MSDMGTGQLAEVLARFRMPLYYLLAVSFLIGVYSMERSQK
jgi:hypothetical protein